MIEVPGPIRIACIVEGAGEAKAVPALVGRIAHSLHPTATVVPILSQRVSRSRIVGEPPYLENAIELAARTAGSGGAILLLVDADDDCPATLGPTLLQRARQARVDMPVSVVLANREYEAWFLASSTSLRGRDGLPVTLAAPPEPERIRDAKGWLTRQMPSGRPYKETIHQLMFTRVFDLALARSADSFDKLCRDIGTLVDAASRGS